MYVEIVKSASVPLAYQYPGLSLGELLLHETAPETERGLNPWEAV